MQGTVSSDEDLYTFKALSGSTCGHVDRLYRNCKHLKVFLSHDLTSLNGLAMVTKRKNSIFSLPL